MIFCRRVLLACLHLLTLYLWFLRQGLHFASSWWLHLLYSSWMNRQTILISHQKKCLRSDTVLVLYNNHFLWSISSSFLSLSLMLDWGNFLACSPNNFISCMTGGNIRIYRYCNNSFSWPVLYKTNCEQSHWSERSDYPRLSRRLQCKLSYDLRNLPHLYVELFAYNSSP